MTISKMRGKPDIVLLHFPGCPHVDAARVNLRQALTQAGLPPSWRETDIAAPETPRELRAHPSPTILVDGQDVNGTLGAPQADLSCRVGGAPGVDVIEAALTRAKTR